MDGSGPFGQGHDGDIRDFNKPPAGQPGLWCRWEPTKDGTAIKWNGVEKFYYSEEWMTYLIEVFLKPGAVLASELASTVPVSQHETADSGSVRRVAAWLVSWIIRRWS